MSDTAKNRLYALTCIACIAWLVQSIHEYVKHGTLISYGSIIFIVCLLTVIIYTGINALRGFVRGTARTGSGTDAEERPVEDSAGKADESFADSSSDTGDTFAEGASSAADASAAG
ncbi:MAG: hypothetical protein ACFNLK_03890 [Scardovia wiggsiae]|nr:hypothetical protein [Scardovia wiggsiae]